MVSRDNRDVVLSGARIVDGLGGPPVEDACVVLRNNKIHAILKNEQVEGEGFRRIDASGKTILPGLMDMHIHLRMGPDDSWKMGPMKVPVHLDLPLTSIGIRGFSRARQALHAGFTTIRDVGCVGNLGQSLRDAIDGGIVEGPRIVACGTNFGATGGTTDYIPDWLKRTDVDGRLIDGVDEIRRMVRSLVKNRVDWVKFFATGTYGAKSITQEYTDQEIAAIMEEAHARGKPVCAHACYAKGTLAIVKAGIDSVEHGSDLTDEIIELMLEKGTYLVPTMYVFHANAYDGEAYGMPSELIAIARAKCEDHVLSYQKALKAGVKMVAGSDIGAPVCPHGTSAREISLLVKYGMSPMEAIVAATRTAAQMIKRDDLGTLEVGKLADLVVVDGNPLEDITILENPDRISIVMKDGVTHVDRLNSARN
jgi:imidazolonepropionase-like amidohydrolase